MFGILFLKKIQNYDRHDSILIEDQNIHINVIFWFQLNDNDVNDVEVLKDLYDNHKTK